MSMTAEITGIGQYRPELVESMPYTPEHYENIKPGSVVIAQVLQTTGRLNSYRMAEALGVDPMDFGTHAIKRSRIKWDVLNELFEPKDVEDFRRLVDADFLLIYTPDF